MKIIKGLFQFQMNEPVLIIILLGGGIGVAITGGTTTTDQPTTNNSIVERAKQEFTQCRHDQNKGPPDERNGWFACWSLFIKWKSIEGDYSQLGPLFTQRIREGGPGSTPCLTRKAARLCKRLCGMDLWKISQETLNPQNPLISNMTWREHPWVMACRRNHLMFRCGPSGISCWTGHGLASTIITELGQTRDFGIGKGITLPLCRYPNNLTMDKISELALGEEELPDGLSEIPKSFSSFERAFREGESRSRNKADWDTLKSKRRVKFLKWFGYPSLVNIKAESDTVPIQEKLPLNIGKWKTWNGTKELLQNKRMKFDPKELNLQGEIKLLKLELRFVRDILEPRRGTDLAVKWARFAFKLASAKLGETPNYPNDELTTEYKDVVKKSASLLDQVPQGTTPYELWPYYLGIGVVVPYELGAKQYTAHVIKNAEDYLRMTICGKVPEVLEKMKRSSEWVEKVNNPQGPVDLLRNFNDLVRISEGNSSPTTEGEDVVDNTSYVDPLGIEASIGSEEVGATTGSTPTLPETPGTESQFHSLHNATIVSDDGDGNDYGVDGVDCDNDDDENDGDDDDDGEDGDNGDVDDDNPSSAATVMATTTASMVSIETTATTKTTVTTVVTAKTATTVTTNSTNQRIPQTSGDTVQEPTSTEDQPKVRERVNRSANDQGGDGGSQGPNRGIDSQNGAFDEEVNRRIEVWINKAQETLASSVRRHNNPFDGIAGNLRTIWDETSDENQLWSKIGKEASQYQVTTSAVPDETIFWERLREIEVSDQNAILEITAPISPLIDMMDDLAFHIDVHQNQKKEKFDATGRVDEADGGWFWSSLKSPRDHTQFGDGTPEQLVEKAETFRRYEQAGIDHTLETNANIAKHCQQRAYLEIYRQGFKSYDGTTSVNDLTKGKVLNRPKKSLTSAAISIASGFGGMLLGLASARPHVEVEVEGLRKAVFNLHRRTGAMIRAESVIKTKLSGVDQDVAAARRGILSSSSTTAVCEASRTIRDTLFKVDHNEVPLELFKDRDEMVTALGEVEEHLLEPNGLELVLNGTEYPEQLLALKGVGHLSVSPRDVVLQEGLSETVESKGELGYTWTHNDQDLSQSTIDLSSSATDAKYKEDLIDYTFLKNVQHKVHGSGKRPDYLKNMWNLRLNIEIPTREVGKPRKYVHIRPTEQLFKLGGRVVHLDIKEVIVKNSENNETGTIKLEDFKKCQMFKSQLRMVCPSEVIRKENGCSSSLLKGTLHRSCLKFMKIWPLDKPYIHSPKNDLNFILYIPTNKSLELKCGGEVDWTRRKDVGLTALRGQPTCKVKIGSKVKTILPRMTHKSNLWLKGHDLKIREALLGAPFIKSIGVDNLLREVDSSLKEAQSLHDIFDHLKLKGNKGYIAKFKEICREMTHVITVLCIGLVLGFVGYMSAQIWWNVRIKRTLGVRRSPRKPSLNESLEEGEEVLPSEQKYANTPKLGNRVSSKPSKSATSEGSGNPETQRLLQSLLQNTNIQVQGTVNLEGINGVGTLRYLGKGIFTMTEEHSGRKYYLSMSEVRNDSETERTKFLGFRSYDLAGVGPPPDGY